MPRYIDAEELKESIMAGVINPQDTFTAESICDAIDETASADVQEVRHGHWIKSPDGIQPIRCSACNMPAPCEYGEDEWGDKVIARRMSPYCHECGAKMSRTDTVPNPHGVPYEAVLEELRNDPEYGDGFRAVEDAAEKMREAERKERNDILL